MTIPHVAFLSSETLHSKTEAFINHMQGGASKPEPKEIEAIMGIFIDEALHSFMVRAAEAVLTQRQSAESVARRQMERSEALAAGNVTSERVLELDRSNALGAAAAVASSEAALAAARAGVTSAEASVVGAGAAVVAAQSLFSSHLPVVSSTATMAARVCVRRRRRRRAGS